MGENVRIRKGESKGKAEAEEGKTERQGEKTSKRKRKEDDKEIIFRILRKYQINLRREDIDFDNNIYLLDSENLRVAHLKRIGYKHYLLCSVSKLPQARGKKNIKFLYEVIAYMFLKTDALMIDTSVYKNNIQARIAHAANPSGKIVWENEHEIYKRWKIGDVYQYASPRRKKILMDKMMRSLNLE